MKLFGSKDNDEALNDGLEDDVFEGSFDTEESAPLDLDEGLGADGGHLSAPTRDFDGGKKSRKGLLLVLLLLIAGGGAGGYYYLNMMNADVPMGAPKAAKMLPPKNAAPAPTIIGADVPPMPQPEVDTTIAQPEIGVDTPDPFAAMEATAAPVQEAGATAIDMPGFDTPAGADAPMADDPFAAMGETVSGAADPAPADASAGMTDVMADLGMPPATEDAATAVPADEFVVVDAPVEVEGEAPAVTTEAAPDMPVDIPGDLPAETPTVSADTAAEPAPAEAAPGFAEMAERTANSPAGDLPMPTMSDVMAVTGDEATPPAVPEKAPATDTAQTAPPPTDAEKAIVENSAMLDQLSAPAPATAADPAAAGKTAQEILGEPAVIRRLPDTYLVVRKDHASSEMDTRLKVARIALMEGRFAAAVQLFDEMKTDYPRDERILMGRALALQQAGRVDESLAAYEDVLSANPKNLEALTNMLGILKATNPALAVEKLEELRAVYPYNADIAAQLGTAYAGLKNYQAALQYLDMADALEPGNAYVYYNKAVLYDHMGQQNMATSMYRRILQMYSEGRLQEPLPLDAIRRRLATMQ